MRKAILLGVLFLSQFCNAEWISSFEDGKKMALASNKFMIVDFWAIWCGPCKKMDANSWNDERVKSVMENYIQVKIDFDTNRELVKSYSVNGIPNIFIMDGNGKVVFSVLGYLNANDLLKELDKFALSTEYLSMDLINYFKVQNFNSSIRVSQKYFDYSLLVDAAIKNDFIKISEDYLLDAKRELSKKDENYIEKKQKLELIELFRFAYNFNFEKLDKKLAELAESEIKENNLGHYYFLKYLILKAMNKDDFSALTERAKKIDDFDYFIRKADFIISKKV